MKRLILIAISMATFLQVNAQNNITLNINHKLGGSDFAMNQAAKNNMDHDFDITRLEYYISEISLIHDSGLETAIDDMYILVQAQNATTVELGSYDVSSVEKIKFHIGVDRGSNHLDPSTYNASHPLAPKSPSMHWGWTAGYRFVALEGNGGTNLNQLIQLHGLDDANYFTTEIDLDVTAGSGALSIDLDADYTRAMENISVNSGVIVHGANLEAKQCLENFRDHVFSQAGTTSSTIDFSEVNNFDVFPNPIVGGSSRITLDIDRTTGFKYDVAINSMEGRQLQYQSEVRDGQEIEFSDYVSGMYIVNLIIEGQTIITKKVFVK